MSYTDPTYLANFSKEQKMKAQMYSGAYIKGTPMNYWDGEKELPCVISKVDMSSPRAATVIATLDNGDQVFGLWTVFSFKPLDFDVKVGDGIVLPHGTRHVARGLLTPGAAAEQTLNPNDKATNVVGVLVIGKDGKEVRLHKGQFRLETFKEYITRPTGFGKTAWPAFALIQAVCMALLIFGFAHIREEGLVELAFFAAIEGVLFLGTWMNFKHRWV